MVLYVAACFVPLLGTISFLTREFLVSSPCAFSNLEGYSGEGFQTERVSVETGTTLGQEIRIQHRSIRGVIAPQFDSRASRISAVQSGVQNPPVQFWIVT